ncbi:UNVERIFIED_CONTAM: hypothetical protein FKN15_006354 [Acipenser sinensis]
MNQDLKGEIEKGSLTSAALGQAYQAQLMESLSENHRPSSQQLEELRLINRNLLWLSKLSGQAIGRNLAALVAACRQLWLSQARVLDADKTTLLDVTVTPGHTFGPVVDEMLHEAARNRVPRRKASFQAPYA